MNNPINYVDPTGHWSWKKFWHAAVGAIVGVVAALVLGPGGALAWYGATMSWAIGGAIGGAITGGLEGGWKGALMGAGIGGALGGFGAWGVGQYGAGFGYGMLAAGAVIAGLTDSWDAYTGGFVGGIAGAAVGNSINQSFNSQNTQRNSLGKPTSGTKDGHPNKALVVDKGKSASGDPIIDDPAVRAEMEKAWQESFSQDGQRVYEQGGWITKENSKYSVQRWPRGSSGSINVPTRPDNIVGWFHTHPYAPYETPFHMPSPADYSLARTKMYGLSNYIVDKEGIMRYYPSTGSQDPRTGTFEDMVRR